MDVCISMAIIINAECRTENCVRASKRIVDFGQLKCSKPGVGNIFGVNGQKMKINFFTGHKSTMLNKSL